MPSVPTQKAFRRPSTTKAQTPGKETWRFDGANESFVAVLSVSRYQIQARGKGAIAIFNPGAIDGPKHRMAVQELSAKVANKMWHARKAAIKLTSIQNGRRLIALARELDKRNVPDPYFKALGRLFPQFGGVSEFDIAMEKRRKIAVRNQYNKKFGALPDDSWTTDQVEAKIKGRIADIECVLEEAADFDPFMDPSVQETNAANLMREVDDALDAVRDSGGQIPQDAFEDDDEEEILDEPPPIEEVKKAVLSTEAADIAQLKAILSEKYGIKKFAGNPGAKRLREILAEVSTKAVGS